MTMEQPVDIKYCIGSCNEGVIPSHEWFNPVLLDLIDISNCVKNEARA